MSDDLTTELRELAGSGQAPPSVPGAEIRRRAGARRRRRRAAALAGGSVAVLCLALAPNLTDLTHPDAPDRLTPVSTPSTRAQPFATVDLSHRTLTVGARSLAVTAGRWPSSVPEGRMTVTAREEVKVIPAMALGLRSTRVAELRWLVELRGDDGTTVYLSSMPSVTGEPGHADRTHDWIAFDTADAQWLYAQLRPGDAVDVTSD
ncbi:L,D-transpeptidase [Streptomyces sp. NPDC087512]|uniref:L,D-transpeptidase n=1 Tax=Streptomyces sp. NPDC087512 TaxID=3155059 RepID=UPI003433409D